MRWNQVSAIHEANEEQNKNKVHDCDSSGCTMIQMMDGLWTFDQIAAFTV